MELPRRNGDDVYVSDGSFSRLVAGLRAARQAHHWSPVVVYPFDNRTRLMPFRWLDRRVVPCGARSIAATLLECGFSKTRLVLQQWNPNFSPSATVRGGHPIDLLLISSMGLHADEAYGFIRDTHTLGEDRPLILMGGPKAIYEPEDCFGRGREDGSVDAAVTGEEYVLFDLLRLLVEEAAAGERPLHVFHRVRQQGLLDQIPGLVYRAPGQEARKPVLLHTGVQRLLRDLDELPMPLGGFRCLERPHRQRTLRAKPASLEEVRRQSFIATLAATHGCRFRCDFCPIPAYQQRTWRHKSPQRLADEIKQLAEAMRFRYFFGTDDNFFNDRGSAAAILTAMAGSNINGRPLRDSVHFVTEATVSDVSKNRDLLGLARDAGLQTLYLGIEDLNGTLIKKGQTGGKVQDLFRELHRHEIEAYAMMIHHDDQPFWSTDPKQLGVVNQSFRLFNLGAVAYHSTYITPSMGARNVETMFGSGQVIARIGGRDVPEAFYDGNHVIATRHRRPWVRQIHLALAHVSFYNPINLVRTLVKDLRLRHERRRFKWQIIGASMLPASILKIIPFTLSLAFGKIEKHKKTPSRRLAMFDAHTGERLQWGMAGDTSDERPHARGAGTTPHEPTVASR